MERNGASSDPPSCAMEQREDLARSAALLAHETTPTGFMPRALCLWAVALWTGCACASASPWSAVSMAAAAAEIGPPLLVSALVISGIVGGLAWRTWIRARAAGESSMRSGERSSAHAAVDSGCAKSSVTQAAKAVTNRESMIAQRTTLCVLLVAAILTGAGLRFALTVREAGLPQLVVPSDGQLVTLEATIASPFIARGFAVDILARYFEKPDRYQCRVEDVVFIADDGTRVPLAAACGGDASDASAHSDAALLVSVLEKPPPCRVTDRVRIVGRLYGLHSARNPSDGDPVAIAARRGIVGSVSIESPHLCIPVSRYRSPTPFADSFARLREATRSRLREALLSGVPDDETHAVRSTLVALVLGDAEEGYAAVETSFRAVGLAHILAISGFNLSVLGWVVATAAGFFVRGTRLRAVPVALAALAALWLMAPAASATRSALMAICGAMGASCGRDWNGDAILAAAATIMLIHEPSIATNAGFQLSFACVLALRHLVPAVRERWLSWIPGDQVWQRHAPLTGIIGEFASRALAAGIATFLASAPIALAHFGAIQPWGLVLTLLCAPLSTVTLALAYPKALLGLVCPSMVAPLGLPLWLATWLQLEFVDTSLGLLGASWQVELMPLMSAVSLLACVTLMLLGTRARLRRLALACAITLVASPLLAREVSKSPPHFVSTMLAVGDGSMHFIETGDAVVVFDAGSSSHGGAATRIAVPWIGAHGGVVHTAFVSHPNLDHFSALLDLARYARVQRLIVHESFIEAARPGSAMRELLDGLRARGTVIETLAAGDSVRIGHAQWTVLWPAAKFRSKRENDLSLVIRVAVDACAPSKQSARFLFTGDIETEPAARLVAESQPSRGDLTRNDALDIACDVIELPHHGSWREAVVGLLKAANPRIVLQSTAQPRFDADRYAKHLAEGTQRFVTCRDGAVQVRVEGDTLASFAFDRAAVDSWRPMGRRKIRPRVVRLRVSVAMRTCVWREKNRSALQHHAIAYRTVTTIVETESEQAALRRRRRYRELRATRCRIKDDFVGSLSKDFDTHSDASISGRGLRQDELAAKDGALAAINDLPGQHERDRDGAIEQDICASEEKSLAVFDAHGVDDAVAIGAIGNGGGERGAVCERNEICALEDAGQRVGSRVVGCESGSNAGKPFGCERETPTDCRIEVEIAPSHDRTIHGPKVGALSRRAWNAGKTDRGNTLHRNATIAVCWVACCCWLVCCWCRRFGRRLGRRLVCWFERCEFNLFTQPLDVAAHSIAVEQHQGVLVGTSNRRPVGEHLDRSKAVDLETHGADPSMLPHGLAVDDSKGAREPLTVSGCDDPQRQRSAQRQGALRSDVGCFVGGKCGGAQRGSGHRADFGCVGAHDHERDDGGAIDHDCGGAEGLSRNDGPVLLVQSRERTNDPLAVALQDFDDGTASKVAFVARVGELRSDFEQHSRFTRADRTEGRRDGEDRTCEGSTHGDGAVAARDQPSDARAEWEQRPAEDRGSVAHTWVRQVTHGFSRSESLALLSALEDREISLRHLEHDQRHRRPVRIAKLLVRPRSIGVLSRQQLFSDRWPPNFPTLAAREIHRLDGVVLPVEIVGLRKPAAEGTAAREGVLRQIVEPTLDRLVFVDAGVEKARHTRSRARPRRSANILHVSKPAVVVLARTHVANRVINRRLRHLDAGVASAAKRHDLTDRHGDIGVSGDGVVTPAPLIVLATHDQLDGASQRVADPIVLRVHAVDLAEEKCGEAVSVHRSVRLIRHKEAGLGCVGEHEVECLSNVVTEVAAARDIAVAHEGDRRETRHANVFAKATLPKRAVRLLLTPQELEASLDRLFKLDSDLLGRGSILRTATLQLLRGRRRGGIGIRWRLRRRCLHCGRWCRRDGCVPCIASARFHGLLKSRPEDLKTKDFKTKEFTSNEFKLTKLKPEAREWCTARPFHCSARGGAECCGFHSWSLARKDARDGEQHSSTHHDERVWSRPWVRRVCGGLSCRMTRGPPLKLRLRRGVREHCGTLSSLRAWLLHALFAHAWMLSARDHLSARKRVRSNERSRSTVALREEKPLQLSKRTAHLDASSASLR